MNILDFTYEMLKIFWWLFIIALPGIYLISSDTVKGIHEKTQSKPKKPVVEVEVLLRTTPQREPDELTLAQI